MVKYCDEGNRPKAGNAPLDPSMVNAKLNWFFKI